MAKLDEVNWAPIAAAPGTHKEVLRLLSENVPSGAKVLDLPCGAGALADAATQMGYDMTMMDIHPNEPFYADPARRVLGDANQRLPFDDEAFDAVCCVEGIEHLENPRHLLRELCRVVKRNGYVLLSTPNVDSFRSRRNLFFKGYHRYFRPLDSGEKDSGHVLPIDYYFVKYSLDATELDVKALSTNTFEGRSGKTLFREFYRKFMTAAYPDDLKQPVPFYGDVIIYLLQRRGAG